MIDLIVEIWGLRVQVALVPIIIMTVGLLLFWKFYDLTTEKKVEIRKQLEEMNL